MLPKEVHRTRRRPGREERQLKVTDTITVACPLQCLSVREFRMGADGAVRWGGHGKLRVAPEGCPGGGGREGNGGEHLALERKTSHQPSRTFQPWRATCNMARAIVHLGTFRLSGLGGESSSGAAHRCLCVSQHAKRAQGVVGR